MKDIDAIRQDLAANRLRLKADCQNLRAELDYVGKAKRSIAARPLPWLGGSILGGWLLSGGIKGLFGRNRKPKKNSGAEEPVKKLGLLGLLIAAIRLLFPIFQPMLSAYATKHVTAYVGQRFKR